MINWIGEAAKNPVDRERIQNFSRAVVDLVTGTPNQGSATFALAKAEILLGYALCCIAAAGRKATEPTDLDELVPRLMAIASRHYASRPAA